MLSIANNFATSIPQRHCAAATKTQLDALCACPAAVEHKIDTLVAAPAAVEEALASLIVDNQDKYHALQYRALVTYVKRIYHPFLMCEPQVRAARTWACTMSFRMDIALQSDLGLCKCIVLVCRSRSPLHCSTQRLSVTMQVNQAGNMLTATWMFHDPRTEQTEARRQTIGAFLVVPSLKYASLHMALCWPSISAIGPVVWHVKLVSVTSCNRTCIVAYLMSGSIVLWQGRRGN